MRPLRSPCQAPILAARGGAGRGGEVSGRAGTQAPGGATALRAVGAREVEARGPPRSALCSPAPRAGLRLDTGERRKPGQGAPPPSGGRTAAKEGARGPARLPFELGRHQQEAQLGACLIPSLRSPSPARPGPAPGAQGSSDGPVSSPPANATSSKTRPPHPAWRATRPGAAPAAAQARGLQIPGGGGRERRAEHGFPAASTSPRRPHRLELGVG